MVFGEEWPGSETDAGEGCEGGSGSVAMRHGCDGIGCGRSGLALE